MAIHFSIAKRGLLPQEKSQQEITEQTDTRSLRPVLECQQVVDAVEFQSGNLRLPSVMPKGELMAALSIMQSVILHEMEKGNAVSLPGIGTFRLSLKGDIEQKDGHYHGRNVRVDSLQFRPDRELLSKVRNFEVEQVPFGLEFQTDEAEVEARLSELFARQNIITHKDLATALEHRLTRNRIVLLLNRLVQKGRIIREGIGAQTRYRLP